MLIIAITDRELCNSPKLLLTKEHIFDYLAFFANSFRLPKSCLSIFTHVTHQPHENELCMYVNLMENGKVASPHKPLFIHLRRTAFLLLFPVKSHRKNSSFVFHPEFRTPRNNKSTPAGLALSSVSRCLEPLMKQET